MHIFIVFPNQLFEKPNFKKYDAIYVVEEHVYFYDVKYKPFKANKIKLAYLRACMRYYFDTHQKKYGNKLRYIAYDDPALANYEFAKGASQITFHDPTDHDLIKKISTFVDQRKITILDTPQFLLSKSDLHGYDAKYRKSPRHASFYEYSKSIMNVLKGVPNLDAMNRDNIPAQTPIKPSDTYIYKPTNAILKYYKEAIDYVNSKFASHIGDASGVVTYAITPHDSYKRLSKFLNNSFSKFGKFQDAIRDDQVFLYHTVVSPMLNIGIMNPQKTLEMINKFYNKHKSTVTLNNYEGLVRQIIGWREYMRYLYLFHYDDLIASNLPQNTHKLNNSRWYNGTTGIIPLDEEIKKAVKFGYAHHIVRLMVFLNFFILCEIHPHEIYKWFMEVVSIDAYSWVMISNIYAMGYFFNNAMTKPYISTSRYIVNMSNYKKDGHWDEIWDGLFYRFVSKKTNKYVAFYKRNLRAAKHIEKADAFMTKYV